MEGNRTDNLLSDKRQIVVDNKLSSNEHLQCIIIDLVSTLNILNIQSEEFKHLNRIYNFFKLLKSNEAILNKKSEAFIFTCEILTDKIIEILQSKDLKLPVDNIIFEILQICLGYGSLKKCSLLLSEIEANFCIFSTQNSIENKIIINLYFLETVLKTIQEKLNFGEFGINPEILCKLNSETLCRPLIDLVFSSKKVVKSTILLSLFPKLLIITKTNLILKYVWEYISNNSLKTTELNDKLFCLCSLADYFLTTSSARISLCLMNEEEFWKIIQLGLINNDPLLRKEALYLLKRAVDVADQKSGVINTGLFSWKSTNKVTLKQLWELVFIILEVLEEKQAHLVIPVLPSVLKIQDACELSSHENLYALHPSWLLCVYNRIFKHDSMQIIKWGVISFLKIDIKLYEKTQYELTIHAILETINNMSLFAKQPDKLLELSEVEVELNKWFLSISNRCENCKLFFSIILSATSKIHWSPVPLFHFLNSFSSIKGVKVWDNSCLNMIKDFVGEALSTQTVYIRGAIQGTLLGILINLSDSNAINIDIVMNTLNAFRHSESLCRGTETWSIVVNWLKTFISEKDAQSFIRLHLSKENLEIHLSSESIARSLILLFDAGLILNENNRPTDFTFDLIRSYFECLDGAGVRLYSCVKTQDERLKLIKNILIELRFNDNDTDLHQNICNTSMYKVLQKPITSIIPYLHRRLRGITEINDYYSIELYIDLLNCLTKSGFITTDNLENILTLQDKAFEISTRPIEDNDPPIKRYFSLQILNWSAKYISFKNYVPTSMLTIITKFVKHMINNNRLNIILCREKKDVNLTRNFQVLWGHVASETIQASWSILNEYSKINHLSQADFLTLITPPKDFILQGLEALQIGGRHIVLYVLDVFRIILPKLLRSSSEVDVELTIKLIASSWKTCFELRKMELFWTAFKKWIEMFFQKDIIAGRHNNQNVFYYSEQILSQGESITGLCSVFVSHLQSELTDLDIQGLHLLKNVLVSALLFGTLQRRDQRIESDTIEYIKTLGSKCSINELISDSNRPRNDSTVRLHALDIILKSAYKDKERGQQLVVAVIDQLLDKEQEMTNKRQRYYGDSLHHRIKNRILQSLLVLESVLAESTSDIAQKCIEELHHWSYKNLKGESQQPSIRYQLEWLFIRTFFHSSTVRSDFWHKFDLASKDRIGSLCSFISIAYHLAVLMKDDEFIDLSVQHILPGCMGQNFNVQLYAQTVLEKLLKLSPVVSLRYKFLEKCIPANLAQGNAARNAVKLKQDFYFTVFHPIKHFSLQTIFFELPRLSNLTYEEWISLPDLDKTIVKEYPAVPKSNLDSDLSNFQAASWILKATEPSKNQVDVAGMQKKFVPWKGMTPDCDMVNGEESTTTKDGLVVVASLIDKVPNLGGLSRTCEIFAVSSLVLGSLEYVQNKEFSVLSMSAEKHIQITEVKPHNLTEYLCLMKKSGYTVVGAEQTAGSVTLDTFQFPKKCLLLLGNEKEGIPVNLIHLLDKCVEIPQHGVVRSLNVHVTGALFVWEYTKQHQR